MNFSKNPRELFQKDLSPIPGPIINVLLAGEIFIYIVFILQMVPLLVNKCPTISMTSAVYLEQYLIETWTQSLIIVFCTMGRGTKTFQLSPSIFSDFLEIAVASKLYKGS